MSWLPAILVLGGLILLHELGHFLAAAACGVEVEEFSLGFGPRLASVRRGATQYSLRLLPVLGYVRMAGMYPVPSDALREEEDPGDVPARGALADALRSEDANRRGVGFASRPLWQRVLIIAAGPFANFAIAFVLFAVVFGLVGLPVAPTLRIHSVEPGSPAAAAGLRPGDTVVSVDGRAVHSWDGLHRAIVAEYSPDVPLSIVVRHGGRVETIAVTPQRTSTGPLIGIVPTMATVRLPLPKALLAGAAQTGLSVYQSLAGLVSLIAAAIRHTHSQAQLMGPIGIGSQIDQASEAGAPVLLLLAGLLSANLGLLNLLPVPALDGGRLLFLGLEWVRGGRAVDPAKEGLVHFIGLAVLMAFILLVSVHDIARAG
jgi:regulator of sigma E protease